MNFGRQKSYIAHIDTPEVFVHCKLTQVHTPLGSGVVCQLPLWREEFRLPKLLHSTLDKIPLFAPR